jgi:hypothetical protein
VRLRKDGSVLRLGADVATLVIGCGLVGWGIWLLLTADPDGGRHPMGVFMLVVGPLAVVVAVLGIRRHRRRRAL